ncbi:MULTISPECIES: S41 family peptidase [Sphingobacterium]|uniref:S41 family peptidase n=1 Tax=Sphingobacterium tenebrionis TaxID=3111775 RepID=A0ABU8I693_9SPHI|nr:S41 family peptidase [Sphingobacterium sp. CZ-2]QBR11394.1 hypothetical protein E3D81_04070 [Sphingobacterium sp. CZ-2]
MRSGIFNLLIIVSLFTSINCQAQTSTLDTFISVLEENSIYGKEVNWSKLKKELMHAEQFASLDSTTRIISSIQFIYQKLNDRHGSFFYNGKTYKGQFNDHFSKADSTILSYALDEKYAIRTTILADRYAYICIPSPSIPTSVFDNELEAVKILSAMGKQLQNIYLEVLNENIEGVIIDFRLSLGGAYPILISSLAPVLGDGIIFQMQGLDALNTSTVKLTKGNLYEDDRLIAQTDYNGSKIGSKVAILLGPLTSSAAEQSAIAFKGRKNVKYIGENSAGYLSMTSLFNFSNGNYFTYSSKLLRANDQKVYKTFLKPDIEVIGGDNFEDLYADKKVIRALEWFKNSK